MAHFSLTPPTGLFSLYIIVKNPFSSTMIVFCFFFKNESFLMCLNKRLIVENMGQYSIFFSPLNHEGSKHTSVFKLLTILIDMHGITLSCVPSHEIWMILNQHWSSAMTLGLPECSQSSRLKCSLLNIMNHLQTELSTNSISINSTDLFLLFIQHFSLLEIKEHQMTKITHFSPFLLLT